MRNKPAVFVLTVFILLVGACGAGAEKVAFDAYEQEVNGILERETELGRLYDEEDRNKVAYRREDSFRQLVREKMIPFYEEMAKTVKSVTPDGEELAGIHDMLVRYVALRQELLGLDTREAEVSDLEKPALKRLNKAVKEREKKTHDFNNAPPSSPELMEKLTILFGTEQQAALSVVQSLQGVRGGQISPEVFLKYLDEKVDPFYDRLLEELARIKVSPMEQSVMLKAKAYVGSTMAFFLAARAVAKIRPVMDEQLAPLRERRVELLTLADSLIAEYRKAAGAYHDSLR